MKILLVSPATPDTFWSFKHIMKFIAKRAAYPPLGLLTVAAMFPRDWQLKLVDLNATDLSDADLDWADYVCVSAMLVQAESTRQILARCHARHKPVIAGGPLFTTSHDQFPHVRTVVLGEAETVMPALVADLTAGTLQSTYQAAERPDIRLTPVPAGT